MNKKLDLGDILGDVLLFGLFLAIVIWIITIPGTHTKYDCIKGKLMRIHSDKIELDGTGRESNYFPLSLDPQLKDQLYSIMYKDGNAYVSIWYEHKDGYGAKGSYVNYTILYQLECNGKVLKKYDWIRDHGMLKVMVPIGILLGLLVIYITRSLIRQYKSNITPD